MSRDGGKNWKKLNDRIPGHPGYWMSRIVASSHFAGTAYLAFTGYRHDDFGPFLYKTSDYGETWVSIAGNLPNEPINVIREDPWNPNLLFVGTDLGLHISLDGGKSWIKLKNNMPTQPVHDLKIHPREKEIIVATHGRSIFIADISPLEEMTPEVLAKNIHLYSIKPKVRWVVNKTPHSSSANFNGESEPNAVAIYYHLKTRITSPVKIQIWKGDRLINEMDGPNSPGLNRVLWNMLIRRERSEAEIKALQERLGRVRAFGGFDPKFVTTPAPAGEYRVVLKVGSTELSAMAVIKEDEWFDRNVR